MYENETYDVILQRMLDRVSDKLDKRESSLIWDTHSSTAIELQIIYIELETLITNSYGDTAAREFLIRLCKDRGITPEAATNTILKGEFIPATIDVTGQRFNIGDVNYVVTEMITPGTYQVVCETPGEGFDDIKAFGGRKRCNLTNNGQVVAYQGDAAFTTTGKLTMAVDLNPEGTEEPDASLQFAVGTIVQTMVEQPKFYYKVVPLITEKTTKGAIIRKARWYVSDTPKAGFKLHPDFIVNGAENDYSYHSAFEGSLWDASASAYILDDAQVADFAADMLASIANAKPLSGLTQNATRGNIRKLAQNRGTGWEQLTVQAACATEILMLIEYATFNTQAAIGNGAVFKTDDGSSNMAENTGATVSLGNKSGAVINDNGIQIVSYRGEENPWGNIWKWVDGINRHVTAERNIVYIADHGFKDDTSDAPYEDAGISPCTKEGYVSAFCYSEEYDWLFIAGETDGNSSLPVGDYFWNYQANIWTVAMLGAGWTYSSTAGGFCWFLDNVSGSRTRAVSGRLVYHKRTAVVA